MKKLLVLIMIIAFVFSITSCKDNKVDSTDLKASSYAQQLFQSKYSYIGNNSADSRILELLNIEDKLGEFHFELQTGKEPYSIKLNFKNEFKVREYIDLLMQKYAFIILALIDNASEVQWSYFSDEDNKEVEINVTVRKEDAKNILGKDIKEYGKTESKIQELLNKLEINY